MHPHEQCTDRPKFTHGGCIESELNRAYQKRISHLNRGPALQNLNRYLNKNLNKKSHCDSRSFFDGMRDDCGLAIVEKKGKMSFVQKVCELILPYREFFYSRRIFSNILNGKIEVHLYSDTELSRKRPANIRNLMVIL